MADWNGYNARCNTSDNQWSFLCDRLCVQNKTKDVNAKLLKIVIGHNVPESSVKPILRHCEYHVYGKK